MPLTLKILTPQEILFEGEAEYLIVPSPQGTLGIFAGHTPLYAEVTPGVIEVTGSSPKTFEVSAGIIKVRRDVVTLLIGI